MQNSLVMFIFSVLDWKYPCWANLVQKIKIVSLILNMVPRPIQICRIQWWCSLFWFSIGNTLLGKFGPKISIASLSWDLVPRIIGKFNGDDHFSPFSSEITQYSECNGGVHIIVLYWKCTFWAVLVENFTIACLSWNLVPILIWICWIQWWYLLLLFLTGITLLEKIWSKK